MPSYIEAIVIRPVGDTVGDRDVEAQYEAMKDDLSRWTMGGVWWGDRGIDGPAAVLTIDSGTDALPALFAITEMGYVITRVHLKYKQSSS